MHSPLAVARRAAFVETHIHPCLSETFKDGMELKDATKEFRDFGGSDPQTRKGVVSQCVVTHTVSRRCHALRECFWRCWNSGSDSVERRALLGELCALSYSQYRTPKKVANHNH